ncbi:hypothetical protein SAMN04490187_4520 [Pseudomonas jessenii]|jgi:hypothetical protein|uniref:Uncharacterized protein n=1 Tax=Pseudomonas jessenii TaxID=77298 RepID=A0A1H4SU77_PSEJE|nr:hypothetical protein SAMN04490187_4520 [Pseudomonas jessenii]
MHGVEFIFSSVKKSNECPGDSWQGFILLGREPVEAYCGFKSFGCVAQEKSGQPAINFSSEEFLVHEAQKI